jgi:hypothetical protein
MNQDKMIQNKIRSGRQILTALGLILGITLLGFIQWATAFRGDLLWVMMVGLGILLIGTVLGIMQRALRTSDNRDQSKKHRKHADADWLDDLHRNDPNYLGSPYYRSHLDD